MIPAPNSADHGLARQVEVATVSEWTQTVITYSINNRLHFHLFPLPQQTLNKENKILDFHWHMRKNIYLRR